MRLLVVNAGSSSIKVRVLGDDDTVEAGVDLERHDLAGLREFCDRSGTIDLVGHRVVHGGQRFTAPVMIDDQVLAELSALISLAPLQQPVCIAAMEIVASSLPTTPAVACFDTMFHAALPPEAWTYALPLVWRRRYGLRRFGFHGLSHAYGSRRGAELAGDGARRVVSCHLGSGSSLAAVVDGICVDTTMGFTPNEGIPMATRSGSIDAGMLSWLLEAGVTGVELADGLQNGSGLLGLTGTPDMRVVVERADAGDADARLAIDVWLHRLVQAVAAMAASAGGIDLLVFTGGIGEGAAGLRQAATDRLAWLGISLDRVRNAAIGAEDALASASGAAVAVTVVHAREDLEIARAARAAVAAG